MIGSEVLLWLYEVEGCKTTQPCIYDDLLPVYRVAYGWRDMFHGWFGWSLARLGCVLSKCGNALQERYYRYLPERDYEQYVSAELDRIITNADRQHGYASSDWSVLPE